MELTSGVKDYLDELVKDESNYLVLIYGSSVTGRKNDSSDLDVFVCGSARNYYRKAIVIDDQELEIVFVDANYINYKIEMDIEDNNSYYESVFNNSVILKDSCSLVDKCKNYIEMLKSYTKKQVRKIPLRNQYWLHRLYKDYRQYEDLYSYFNFLDEIRMSLAYMYNYSTLNVGKVYDMYSNPTHAIQDYCLVMPDLEFISHFDASIRNPHNKKEMKWLMRSISFDPLSCLRDRGFSSYVDNHRRKSILIHMDKMVNKAIKMLVMNNPYKDYVYYVVINHMYLFYEEIYGFVTEEFENAFNSAKTESDPLLKVEFLKQIFSLLEGKYAFDYKNYTLYFN